MTNWEREIESVIAALDGERRKGFCDERGILRLWARGLVEKSESAYDIGHKEAVARARVCECALDEIVTNPSLTKQKIMVIAKNARSKAQKLRITGDVR